jgi:hypothetical protein
MGGIYPFVNELQRYGKDGIESIRQNKLPQACYELNIRSADIPRHALLSGIGAISGDVTSLLALVADLGLRRLIAVSGEVTSVLYKMCEWVVTYCMPLY